MRENCVGVIGEGGGERVGKRVRVGESWRGFGFGGLNFIPKPKPTHTLRARAERQSVIIKGRLYLESTMTEFIGKKESKRKTDDRCNC